MPSARLTVYLYPSTISASSAWPSAGLIKESRLIEAPFSGVSSIFTSLIFTNVNENVSEESNKSL